MSLVHCPRCLGKSGIECSRCSGGGWVPLRRMHAIAPRRGGAPGSLTESSTLVRGPAELLDAAKADAEASGLDAAEWWRRAARAYLDRPRPGERRPWGVLG